MLKIMGKKIFTIFELKIFVYLNITRRINMGIGHVNRKAYFFQGNLSLLTLFIYTLRF